MRILKVLLPALALLLLLPGALQAANVCVWNYDTLDRFFDPQVGDSVDCSYHVAATLEDLGHSVSVSNRYLPSSLDDYDIVFCLMGWYRC